MTVSINFVITNSGDGSNGIHWVRDQDVLDRMEEMADNGCETYSSGDGLQVRSLVFPDGFDLDEFVKTNHLNVVTLEDVDQYDF